MCWLCSGFTHKASFSLRAAPLGRHPERLRVAQEATGAHLPRAEGDSSAHRGSQSRRGAPPSQPNLFPRNPLRARQLLTFGAWSTCHGYAPSPCIQGWDSWEETSGSSHLGVAPCLMGTGSESHPRPSPRGVKDCLQTVHLRTAACSLQKINEITHPI